MIKPDQTQHDSYDTTSVVYRTNPCHLDVGIFGFSLFLVSLGIFFAASLVSYLVVRVRADVWRPIDSPPLPEGLWISTLVIIMTSAAIQWGLNAIRKDQKTNLLYALYTTAGLGFIFIILQLLNWETLVHRELLIHDNLYAFTFYFLTGIHALHVIGGIIPLLITIYKAHHQLYTSYHYNGIYYCTMYWHFLDCVWIILFATLLIGS